jgi:hypothetical protein
MFVIAGDVEVFLFALEFAGALLWLTMNRVLMYCCSGAVHQAIVCLTYINFSSM